jgi:hypothetical protein
MAGIVGRGGRENNRNGEEAVAETEFVSEAEAERP